MTHPSTVRQEIDSKFAKGFLADCQKNGIENAARRLAEWVKKGERAAVEEFIELCSGHYWDSLTNDTPIIREHLKGVYKKMFPQPLDNQS
jgi:DNA-binding transcriptional regulator YbjK